MEQLENSPVQLGRESKRSVAEVRKRPDLEDIVLRAKEFGL